MGDSVERVERTEIQLSLIQQKALRPLLSARARAEKLILSTDQQIAQIVDMLLDTMGYDLEKITVESISPTSISIAIRGEPSNNRGVQKGGIGET